MRCPRRPWIRSPSQPSSERPSAPGLPPDRPVGQRGAVGHANRGGHRAQRHPRDGRALGHGAYVPAGDARGDPRIDGANRGIGDRRLRRDGRLPLGRRLRGSRQRPARGGGDRRSRVRRRGRRRRRRHPADHGRRRLLRLPRAGSRSVRPRRRAQRGRRLDIPPPPPTLHGRRAGAADRRRRARPLCTCAARAPADRKETDVGSLRCHEEAAHAPGLRARSGAARTDGEDASTRPVARRLPGQGSGS